MEKIALKIVKWKIAWKKMDFAGLMKDAKSIANFESDQMTSRKHGLAAKSKWRPPNLIFLDKFLQDSGHLRG